MVEDIRDLLKSNVNDKTLLQKTKKEEKISDELEPSHQKRHYLASDSVIDEFQLRRPVFQTNSDKKVYKTWNV